MAAETSKFELEFPDDSALEKSNFISNFDQSNEKDQLSSIKSEHRSETQDDQKSENY